jgi:hypothetical protein
MPEKKDSYQPGTHQIAQAPPTSIPVPATYPGEGHKIPSQESIELLTKLLQEFAKHSQSTTSSVPAEVERDIAVVLAAFDSIKSALGLAESPIAVSGVQPATGGDTGGTRTKILGSHFLPGATVRFGTGVATSVTVVSLTEIQATTPPGLGAVDVVVESLAGSGTLTRGYTYVYGGAGRREEG